MFLKILQKYFVFGSVSIIVLLAMLFDFVLIGLEMQLSFVNIVSLKSLLTMVRDIYADKFVHACIG